MSVRKMHKDEVATDAGLVTRLLAAQFPELADLPVRPVASSGTDHALYRLGNDKVVRLPRIHWAAGQAEKEYRWLPKFAPHLPLTIPEPLAMGSPAEGYPYSWSVYRWIDGENATMGRLADLEQAAVALADFVVALRKIDASDGDRPGPQESGRGVPLRERDEATRTAIESLRGMIDTDAAIALWEEALAAPVWAGPPVWIHGDLMPGNLLVRDGRLCAVIDFGCMGMGDPACDLLPAWNWLSADTREVYRAALKVDDATWARGRGWALSVAVIALPYYKDTNPSLADISRRTIAAVLAPN